jgi:transposase InsO family protein
LQANGLTGSMGRVAAAADNAAMESFYALVQKNVLNRRPRWRTRAELRYELIVWIEHTYNRRRRPGVGYAPLGPAGTRCQRSVRSST